VSVTARIGNTATRVKSPKITKTGNNKLADMAKRLLNVSGKRSGFGICSCSATPTPIFFNPCATTNCSDIAILNMNNNALNVLTEG
jgi:hypothetical protein